MSSHQSPPAGGPLHAPAADAGLDPATRIRIALYLAQRGRDASRAAALRERGRAAGMNGAEMAANAAGTSHEARATACLAFVRTLLEEPGAPSAGDLLRMAQMGYPPGQIAEIMALAGGGDTDADAGAPPAAANIAPGERMN